MSEQSQTIVTMVTFFSDATIQLAVVEIIIVKSFIF